MILKFHFKGVNCLERKKSLTPLRASPATPIIEFLHQRLHILWLKWKSRRRRQPERVLSRMSRFKRTFLLIKLRLGCVRVLAHKASAIPLELNFIFPRID